MQTKPVHIYKISDDQNVINMNVKPADLGKQ